MDPLNRVAKRIFINNKSPLSLILTSKKWYKVSKESKLRAKWILYNYGKAHALFHAIRFGHNFISPTLVDILIKKKAILSRYLAQRLFLQFGRRELKFSRRSRLLLLIWEIDY